MGDWTREDHGTEANAAGAAPAARPSYRPPIGMPYRTDRENRAAGIFSALFHAILIALLIFPFFQPQLGDASTGAGGPGPAGGGGGGTGGTGGAQRPDQVQERLRYIKVTPEQIPTPNTLPPIEEKKEEKEEEKEKPIEIKLDPVATLSSPVDMALEAGVGGGSGNDRTTGSGPGTGGGVGSGVGTGRGTGAGPGTGGGEGTVYPPQPVQVFLPPMPVPSRVRPHTLVAKFDVDSTGRVLAISFNATKDGGYNRLLRASLDGIRFKPAIRWDGRPVRAIGEIVYEF